MSISTFESCSSSANSVVPQGTDLEMHGLAIDELRLRQDILDVLTTNGTFVWKIPDIRRRSREAIDRHTYTGSIYSPPYFTSPKDRMLKELERKLTKDGKSYRKRNNKGYCRGDDTPNLADALKEIHPVVYEWMTLGLYLNVPIEMLEEIDVDKTGVVNKKCAMLRYWLENEENPSWQKLAHAVAQIGKVNLAMNILQRHCQPLPEDDSWEKPFTTNKKGLRKIWGTFKTYTVDKIKHALGKFGDLVSIRRKYKTNKTDVEGQRKARWWFEVAGDESVLEDLEAHWETAAASDHEQWRLERVQVQH